MLQFTTFSQEGPRSKNPWASITSIQPHVKLPKSNVF